MLYEREKKIMVGDMYQEVDIFSRDTEQDLATRKGTRSKKQRVTAPAQSNLNDRNARRYLTQLANGNFGEGDLFVTLTYKSEYAPSTVKEAEHHVTLFLRRVAYRRKKLHLEPLKYILVTEYRTDDDGNMVGKIHHHLIMNTMDRDVLESLWSERRRSLGFARTQKLQPEDAETGNGIEGLVDYLTKDPKGRKRWSSSRNLSRPVSRTNDHKYSRRRIRNLSEDTGGAYTYFKEKYPQWEIVTPVEFIQNKLTGEWNVYLKMWRKATVKQR